MPTKRREPLEASIEQAFVDRAEHCGALTRKLNGLGYKSWPDRWVLPPWLVARLDYLIEFKRPGEEPKALQADLHAELRQRGVDTSVFTAWEDAFAHFVRRTRTGLIGPDLKRFDQRVQEVRDGTWRQAKKRRRAR